MHTVTQPVQVRPSVAVMRKRWKTEVAINTTELSFSAYVEQKTKGLAGEQRFVFSMSAAEAQMFYHRINLADRKFKDAYSSSSRYNLGKLDEDLAAEQSSTMEMFRVVRDALNDAGVSIV